MGSFELAGKIKKMSVPMNHKNWAQHLKLLLGGECTVHNFYDESEKNNVHIFRSINEEGIFVATVGLMEINQSKNKDIELFTEIIMDQRGYDERIENVLSTIAFYILKDGWRVAPGVVFEQMVEMYFPNHPLPHVMFVPPFQWETEMTSVKLETKLIYPLMAVPISEAERQFAAKNEGQDLESLWTSNATDVLNWSRQSAV